MASISDKTVRQDIALNLLQNFLNYEIPHSERITELPENYFLLSEIVQEDRFKAYGYTQDELVQAIHADPALRFSVRENRVRFKPLELNKDRHVQVSKKLAWILRHGAERANLTYKEGGFLYLDEILPLPTFQDVTLDEIVEVVETNNKKRFEIRQDPLDPLRSQIRAFQGHSVEISNLGLKLITDPKAFPVVVHGTYSRAWESIRATGLSRMQRTHIHFSPGEPGDNEVISGMRRSADVLVFIDMEAAMKDGIEFFVSENKVILTTGNEEGYLPVKYFKSVLDRNTRRSLL